MCILLYFLFLRTYLIHKEPISLLVRSLFLLASILTWRHSHPCSTSVLLFLSGTWFSNWLFPWLPQTAASSISSSLALLTCPHYSLILQPSIMFHNDTRSTYTALLMYYFFMLILCNHKMACHIQVSPLETAFDPVSIKRTLEDIVSLCEYFPQDKSRPMDAKTFFM